MFRELSFAWLCETLWQRLLDYELGGLNSFNVVHLGRRLGACWGEAAAGRDRSGDESRRGADAFIQGASGPIRRWTTFPTRPVPLRSGRGFHNFAPGGVWFFWTTSAHAPFGGAKSMSAPHGVT